MLNPGIYSLGDQVITTAVAGLVKNEPGFARAGAHVDEVWWLIAPSDATEIRP